MKIEDEDCGMDFENNASARGQCLRPQIMLLEVVKKLSDSIHSISCSVRNVARTSHDALTESHS
jgi:hypothetical protein